MNQSIESLFLTPYNSCCALESPTLQRDARIGPPIFPVYRIANPLSNESGARYFSLAKMQTEPIIDNDLNGTLKHGAFVVVPHAKCYRLPDTAWEKSRQNRYPF